MELESSTQHEKDKAQRSAKMPKRCYVSGIRRGKLDEQRAEYIDTLIMKRRQEVAERDGQA